MKSTNTHLVLSVREVKALLVVALVLDITITGLTLWAAEHRLGVRTGGGIVVLLATIAALWFTWWIVLRAIHHVDEGERS